MKFLNTEHERKSMIITVILHVLLILLLFLVGMKYLDPPLQAGIAINFGTSEEGMGNVQPVDQIQSAPQVHTALAASQPQPETEMQDEVVTQDVEEAPVIEDKKVEESQPEAPVTEKPEKEVILDPKPDQSTTDALSSILSGSTNDGEPQEGDGKDNMAGDKGDVDGDPDASSYYGSGQGLDGDGNYQLGGRRALHKEKIMQRCDEEGTVVVNIEVDQNGKVTKATPGARGSTNTHPCLMEPARESALATRFNADDQAPSVQVGRIVYRFSLTE